LTEEETNIMIQFAQVFGLIYMRFLDLLKAESQAHEAFRQTALDRVRAEIASMRTTDDLSKITPLIWRELGTLGVPFSRCGIFIIRDTEQFVHAYLSTPEGESLAVLHLSFESTATIQRIVENWRHQKVYTEFWDHQQFQDWVQSLVEQGQIKEVRQYQGGEIPVQSLSLQFIPFSQGMLYVGSTEQLEESQIDLVMQLADSFSVAYARYEDFKQLEDAKNRIEDTLAELKAAQSQLVQSEKMASLGELTAGIAHEIQNPLNFVNNFSEVNVELLEEMKDEINKGNLAEANAIANDVIENQEKINHHGKRADAIVKGMLQHSRSSSGVKEPTDINELTDEYLRLAYHGLRAKDKSFNATMKTEYDESIGKINIIPQDIGRCILNLITNAFYAVTEKKNRLDDSYEPTVSVSTKKINGKSESHRIEIKVSDNGNGIPQNVLDKIFQPFFTTKPTGQGTGLGLSLSYDIIKAHGGELMVETEDGKGAAFIIWLPVKEK
jgi:signal transduction histidine kinase